MMCISDILLLALLLPHRLSCHLVVERNLPLVASQNGGSLRGTSRAPFCIQCVCVPVRRRVQALKVFFLALVLLAGPAPQPVAPWCARRLMISKKARAREPGLEAAVLLVWFANAPRHYALSIVHCHAIALFFCSIEYLSVDMTRIFYFSVYNYNYIFCRLLLYSIILLHSMVYWIHGYMRLLTRKLIFVTFFCLFVTCFSSAGGPCIAAMSLYYALARPNPSFVLRVYYATILP
jgi:hypothetical protein